MTLFSCGGGVFVWQNKNPTAVLAVGFKNSFCETKLNLNRRTAQQQRV